MHVLPASHPANVSHSGGRSPSLPIIPKKDLSFDESILLELNFGRIIVQLLSLVHQNLKSFTDIRIYILKSKLKNLSRHF